MPREEPYYIYLPMYGGVVYRYSEIVPGDSIKVNPKEIIGAFCLKPEDWAKRELYIDRLRQGH